MAAEASNFAQPSIPKFDGDYDHWSMLMENLLRSKEYWSIIETGYTEPAEAETLTATQKKTLEDLKLKDLKAKNYLFSAIEKSILKTIIQKSTSKQLWDSMKRKYQGNIIMQRAQLQTLCREFEILEIKIGESVTDYFSRMMLVANDMRNNGEYMLDVKIIEKILRTLIERFNYIKFQKNGGDEQALKVTSGERLGPSEEDKFGGRGKGRGNLKGRGRGRGRQLIDKATVECFHCHKLGHFRYECPSWDKNINYAEFDEDEEMLLMSHVEMHNSKIEEVWFLDFGCSNHMSGDKRWFIELDESFRKMVKLGNNSKISVMGKGNIRIQFLEKLRTSLFSSGIRGHNNSSVASEVWTLEHEGPENFGIQKLVKGLPILKHSAKLCTDCIVGKQHCDNFPKKSLWRAYQPLQLMHSDICGLITPESNSHKRHVHILDIKRKKLDNKSFKCVFLGLDVKSVFLHGEITEEVFIEQPRGYEVKGAENKVYRLKKALYGLKQAPRAWFSKIESYFIKEGFQRCLSEHTLFKKNGGDGRILIVSLYVDDLIFTGNDGKMFEEFKRSMKQEFEMFDLGRMKHFLGVEVVQGLTGIFISQRKYANEVLERFGMKYCNPVKNLIVLGCRLVKDEGGTKVDSTIYKQMVGSLMYLIATRPDLMYVVSLISRFMEASTELHEYDVKRIFRYLKRITEMGILYKKGGEENLVAFSDSDYAEDLEDRKSTSGYVFKLSYGAVAWSSKKQPVVTLSTTKAEFIAAASCACQSIWMQRVLGKLGLNQSKCTIFCDNSSAIKLSKNPVMHGKSKHIDIRFHFLRELTRDGVVDLVHCGSKDQLACIMTKPLKLDLFLKMRRQLGVCIVQEVN
ncbi:Integrase catalytic domain-containing protein [Citrus sinensis]|uniref:Integrase catalytic domain-containing protein n=1 Tax=Citrus sinensis TaxID=2711 RepID=A0ACB8NAU3_CITSI|nr:Integrase catalytic domain-containing protein [Citrus sinensis]